MISGSVNHHRDEIVRLVVRGRQGQTFETEAIVDTGYNGTLTLPSALIADLELPFRRQGWAVLGDGQEISFRVYEGTVLWNGKVRRIAIDAADADPLLGMALLYGHRLTIEVIEGGSVSITELPRF